MNFIRVSYAVRTDGAVDKQHRGKPLGSISAFRPAYRRWLENDLIGALALLWACYPVRVPTRRSIAHVITHRRPSAVRVRPRVYIGSE
jgi:hypothetical protein